MLKIIVTHNVKRFDVDGLRAFERNWIGLFEALPRYVPDARYWSEGDVSIGMTGIPVAAFNGVFVHDPAALTAVRLPRLTESFDGMPFSIQVCVRDSIPACDGLLRAHGYEIIFEDPILIREGPLLDTPINPAVEVWPIATMEDEAYYQRIISDAFAMPPDLAPDFFDTLVSMQEGRVMIARLNGRAVGAGMLLYCNGVAAVYNVATLPNAQRQGVGTAVMGALQKQALADGYEATVLASSTAGLPMYHKLGYRHEGYQVAYAPAGRY